jgi:hypothetical protein
MRNARYDDLVAQQTRESIATRMESFADEFQRVARTAKQGALAESFSLSVHGVVARNPLTAADLEPLAQWLSSNGDQFEQLARTTEQKELVASFRGFIAEITGPAVKDALQSPLVNALVDEIKSGLAEGHTNGIPIAWLSDADKKEFLSIAIDWTDYINRGLDLRRDTAAHIDCIIDNAIAEKPCEQWMGRADPVAERFEELLNRPSDQAATAMEKEKQRGIER